MNVLRGFKHIDAFNAGMVATIGNFDGVHRGHQALLSALRVESLRLNRPSLVILFEPQPAEYFYASKAPARLSSLREKVLMMRQSGIDYIYCLRFDSIMASMTAATFAERFIFELINARYLLIGEDFHFGKNRVGDLALLQDLAKKHTCVVEPFSDFFIENERVSSTKIRQALQTSQFSTAATLLGRPYSMCGRVIRGDGRGRQWGIPTANLHLNRVSLPLKGVFCVQVKRQNGTVVPGVANIGCRPTVDGQRYVLEVHLIDVDESLYGEHLQVYFLEQLRDEIKFSSVESLIAQIRHDITAARAYFKTMNASIHQCFLE